MISRVETWEKYAACAPVADFIPEMANAWIFEEAYGTKRAKRICETQCKVREWCVKAAVEDPEADGLYGGFYFEDGAVYREDANKIMKLFGLKAKVRRRFVKRDELLAEYAEQRKAENEEYSDTDAEEDL